MHIYVHKNKITYTNYKAKCAIGKRGISKNKVEGDLKTPKGSFNLEYILYRKDRIGQIKTSLKKKIIRRNMVWCDDPLSKYYNQLVKLPFKYSAERLFRKDNIYDVIIVVNFNRKIIKKNKGSAIFIHLAKKNYKPTKGCVAISKPFMLNLVSMISKTTKIIIK